MADTMAAVISFTASWRFLRLASLMLPTAHLNMAGGSLSSSWSMMIERIGLDASAGTPLSISTFAMSMTSPSFFPSFMNESTSAVAISSTALSEWAPTGHFRPSGFCAESSSRADCSLINIKSTTPLRAAHSITACPNEPRLDSDCLTRST